MPINDAKTTGDLQGLMLEARRKANAANGPKIAEHMLYDGSLWGQLKALLLNDDDALRLLLRDALEKRIRAWLKKSNDDEAEDEIAETQLGFWPSQAARALVADIGVAKVWVPSRNEFVKVQPASLSRTEAIEAGNYLIDKGKSTIRRGKNLVRLSRLPGPWV